MLAFTKRLHLWGGSGWTLIIALTLNLLTQSARAEDPSLELIQPSVLQGNSIAA